MHSVPLHTSSGASFSFLGLRPRSSPSIAVATVSGRRIGNLTLLISILFQLMASANTYLDHVTVPYDDCSLEVLISLSYWYLGNFKYIGFYCF